MSLVPDDPRHGTYNGYINLGCRCQPCRDANAAEARRMKLQRASGRGRKPAPHGRYTTYHNYMCRCQPCRDAWAAYVRSLNARRRAGAS